MALKFHHVTAASLAALASALVSQPAMAQSEPAADSENTLGDIVVTARKVGEASQSLPITIAAFSGEELENKVVLDVRDLQAVTPGLTVSNSPTGGVPIFSIRGVSTELGIEGGVALYFNDVPLFSTVGILHQFYDVSTVEVLKGPQGTQFGTNTTGGTISVRSNLPTDEFEGYVKAGYGTFNRREFEGMLNVPLDDSTGIRLAGNYVKRDGYVRNLAAVEGIPDRFDNENHYSLRGTISTDKDFFRNDIIVDYFHRDEAPSGTIPVQFATTRAGFSLDSPAVGQRTGSYRKIYVGPDPSGVIQPLFGKAKLFGFQDKLEIDLSDSLTLRNVLGYRHDHTFTSEDTSGVSLALVHTFKEINAKQWTNDITLRYNGLDGRLRAAVGGYYSDFDLFQATNSNVFQALFLQFFNAPLAVTLHSPENRKTTSKAVYFNTEFDVTDTFGIMGGIRYNWDRVKSEVSASQNAGVLPVFGRVFSTEAPYTCNTLSISQYADNDLPESCVGRRSGSFKAASWNLGVTNEFSSRVLGYAKISHGYLAGGANFTLREVPFFDPEKTTMVEVGLKADWDLAGRPLRTNVALYRGRTKNKQVFANTNYADGGAGYGVVNAAKQSVYGMDLETRFSPFDGMTLDANYNYVNPKFKEFIYPALGTTPSYVLTGATPAQTPKHQLNVGASYVLPTDESTGKITATISGYYTSSIKAFNAVSDFNKAVSEAVGIDFNRIPSYFIANASINWENIMSSPVSVQLWMRNIGGKEYITSRNTQFETFGWSTATFGPPRTFGVTGTVEF